METDRRPLTAHHHLVAVLAALAFVAAAAVFVVPWFGWPSLSGSDESFATASLLAAGFVGFLNWLGVERYCSGRPVLGGVTAGACTGIVAHPVAWILWTLLQPIEGAGSAAVLMTLMSFWSLLFVGWIIVPLGL